MSTLHSSGSRSFPEARRYKLISTSGKLEVATSQLSSQWRRPLLLFSGFARPCSRSPTSNACWKATMGIHPKGKSSVSIRVDTIDQPVVTTCNSLLTGRKTSKIACPGLHSFLRLSVCRPSVLQIAFVLSNASSRPE